MTGSGGTFTIACAVNHVGGSQTFHNQLLSGLNWTLARAPASPMLPRISNGSAGFSPSYGNSSELFPQHIPAATPQPQPVPAPNTTPTPVPTPVPMRGLTFDNVLPAGNSAFGTNSISHSFNGTTFAVSPFALFYQAGTYTHPAGTSKWCGSDSWGLLGHLRPDYQENRLSPIPNWFHYYSQAWQSPQPISFDNSGTSNYEHGSDHVHISFEAYQYYGTRLWETRPGYGPYVVMVGIQATYGIDSFASIVTHECTHKTLYESGLTDTDEDGLPDVYETANHLNPNRADTTRFGETFPKYALTADQDVYCQMQQRDVTGPRELDWANSGLNWGHVPGSCAPNRNPKTYYSSPAVPPV